MTPTPLLTFADVRVEHPGGAIALDRISLRVMRGERVAVIGPSGAGKSTLLALCNAAVVPTAGEVTFDGAAVCDTDSWRRAHGKRVAHIPQELHLVPRLRVVHNVNSARLAEWSTKLALRSLIRPVEVEEVEELLGRVGLRGKAFIRTDRLSGGERQRVAVARALRQRPTLLLADEPTASLDMGTAAEIMNLLARLAGEDRMTMIVSQHDVGLAAASCDRIVGLRGGRIRFDLPAPEVTASILGDLYGIGPALSAER